MPHSRPRDTDTLAEQLDPQLHPIRVALAQHHLDEAQEALEAAARCLTQAGYTTDHPQYTNVWLAQLQLEHAVDTLAEVPICRS